MANRQFQQAQATLEKGLVTLYAVVDIGGTGAPTLKAWNPATRTYSTAGSSGTRGVKSIARTSAGLYSITLQDTYQRVLDVSVLTVLAGGLSTSPICSENSTLTAVNTASAPIVAIALQSTAGTAADPASGDRLKIRMVLQNSTAL